MTQAELAIKAETKQNNISRQEDGDYNPSLQFLNKWHPAWDFTFHSSASHIMVQSSSA